jgi:Fur family ferric uptake transcriptional regulator
MLDDTAGRLRAGGRRLGAARRQALDALTSVDGPVTVEELAARIPDVHLSSVYRSLAVLEEVGVVRHVHIGHGPARYELVEQVGQAVHLVCEVCGRDILAPDAMFEELRQQLEDEFGFVMRGGHTAITGRCDTCAEGPGHHRHPGGRGPTVAPRPDSPFGPHPDSPVGDSTPPFGPHPDSPVAESTPPVGESTPPVGAG